MILHGRNLIIKAGGTAIAAAKSCTIEVQADEIEVSSPLTGQWKTYIAGRKSWKVDVSGLVMVDKDILPAHLQQIGGWIGQTMALSANIVPSELMYPGLLPFAGLVTGITVEQVGLTRWPELIFWDDDNGQFVGLYQMKYYNTWAGGEAYMSPAGGAYFATTDKLYQIQGDWLQFVCVTSGFSGTALCTQARVGGAVGNLVTYTAKFQGSGELGIPQ